MIAVLAKCFLNKHEGLSSNTSTCVKPSMAGCPCKPALGEMWTDPGGSAAIQSSLNGKLQDQERALLPRIKWRAVEEETSTGKKG